MIDKTGTDVLQETLAAWARKQNVAYLARDLQVANEALYSFANGTGTLPPEKLQALTTVLFHGHAEYVPEEDALRHTVKPPPLTLAPCRPKPVTVTPSPATPALGLAAMEGITPPSSGRTGLRSLRPKLSAGV